MFLLLPGRRSGKDVVLQEVWVLGLPKEARLGRAQGSRRLEWGGMSATSRAKGGQFCEL